MPAALMLSVEHDDLVEAFAQSRSAAGMGTGPEVLWRARAFCDRVGMPDDWARLTLEQQVALPTDVRSFVSWLFVTGRLTATADYLIATVHLLGTTASRYHPVFHLQFTDAAMGHGFTANSAQRQWDALARVAALHKVAPDQVNETMLADGQAAMVAAADRQQLPNQQRFKALHGAQATLFHLGQIDTAPVKGAVTAATGRTARQRSAWNQIPPLMATTMRDYIEQLALTQRPATTIRNEAGLRELATFLLTEAPTVVCVADIRRHHIEAYKSWLAARPLHHRTGTMQRASIKNRLTAIRLFFTRLLEWGSDDAPIGPLLFAGDIPMADNPLPRFLDDAAAAKLLQAARADTDPFVRLSIEVLARTGMRKSELVNLTIDAVVQIGSAYWLRVPVGKLHTDRYVPLHPQLKAMIDEWLARRPDGLRSDLMFIHKGRRINVRRVDIALHKVAAVAGIGHVTPHQLRHTLATQAINRGMSLEAIAALLGHKTLTMTMVYARIADRTVANEYFAISEKVEALYNRTDPLPADAEGAEMLKLRKEMTQRMLGNGYCARPVELDCHFESICESCTFFVTTVEFKPTLRRQRDDAAAKGQVGRERIFNGLLERLDDQAS
jgi:site-specific recombinase XerD